MSQRRPDAAIGAGIVLGILLWGGNNVALKRIVATWPPLFTGATRFLVAGLLLLGLLRWTRWLGEWKSPDAALRRDLWWRAGFSLAVYIAACNWTLRFIPASHFALDMATSPIWALLAEHNVQKPGERRRRWIATLLAFAGVAVLIAPAFRAGGQWWGELAGIGTAVLWTWHNRQCKAVATRLSGTAVTAHAMWRAGWLLLPGAVAEVWFAGKFPAMEPRLLGLHAYCITLGGVLPFALWNDALGRWPVSRVALFGNLIPASTMAWNWATSGEPVSPTFGIAMALIVVGVVIGQTDLARHFKRGWVPEE